MPKSALARPSSVAGAKPSAASAPTGLKRPIQALQAPAAALDAKRPRLGMLSGSGIRPAIRPSYTGQAAAKAGATPRPLAKAGAYGSGYNVASATTGAGYGAGKGYGSTGGYGGGK